MKKNCIRCKNLFNSNPLIQGDDVCHTCERMNDLTFWYPRLQQLCFPMPKTIILYSNVNFEAFGCGAEVDGLDEFIRRVEEACITIGLPVFLRTGMTSNKHDWEKSCYVSDLSKLKSHIFNLSEFSSCMTIDRFTPCDFWAVREMLKTKPYMNAFLGNMPITKERRYFVNNGEIKCHHSYWPREAFRDLDDKKFNKLSKFSKKDEDTLNKMALYVANLFTGYWSCDFLQDIKGDWYLTDMAIGEQSYHEKHII